MKVGIAGTGKIVREFLNMQKDQERIEVTLQIMRQARSSPRPRQKEPLWRKIPRFTMW